MGVRLESGTRRKVRLAVSLHLLARWVDLDFLDT